MAAKKPAAKADPRDRKIRELERTNAELGRHGKMLEKWLTERDIKLSAANETIETLARRLTHYIDQGIDRSSEPIPF